MNEKILEMYFSRKMKQIDIAKELNVSKYKVSRVVTKDPRYKKKKEHRKEKNKHKHNEKTKQYISQNRKNKKDIMGYAELKQMHIQASIELSGGRKPINNRAFRNWNKSAYKYDRKSQSYILRKDIVTGIDAPKKIKWNNF